jgi:cell wall assembly regulator SMI1/predicted DNA-binding WGR domain protein
MKKLDRKQRSKLDKLQKAIAEEEPKLKSAIDEYNATVKAAYEKLRSLVGGYTHAQVEFDRFQTKIMDAMTDFVGEYPEEWQESEEGQAYLEWIEAWNEAAVFPLNFKQPPDLTAPDPPFSAIIAALPRNPGEVEKSSDEPVEPGPDTSLNQLRSMTIREDWKRIADFASENFPEGVFRLAEGATQEQIDAAEAILGFSLPDDVRESYRVHNGSLETSFAIIGELSSIEVVARDFAQRRSWPTDGWGTPDEIQGPIRPVWWDTSRVQLTESGSGDGLTIDLDPAEGGTWGQVIHHDHEVGPRRVYAPSWGALLKRIADDAEADKIVYDEDYTWGHLQDWVFDPPIASPLPPGDVEKKPGDTPKGPISTAGRPIDPKTAASVEASWKRIDKWLTQNAPSLMAKMGKGATPESIDRAEATLGVELADAVRASYAIHDGSGGVSLFPSGEYLSLDGMLGQYKIWKELVEEGTFDDEESEPEGPIQKVHYHLKWIPLTHDGGGDHTLIDLAPSEGGKVGQLIDFSHETGPENVASPGLAEYLSLIADGFESGAGPVNGSYIDWHQERGMPRSAFSVPSKASGKEATARRYFEFTAGTSNKFWEIVQEGSTMTTRYGKIGTNGQSTTKSFDSPEKAAAETAKMIAKKVKEGYVEKTP